jgi:hypothetical protein
MDTELCNYMLAFWFTCWFPTLLFLRLLQQRGTDITTIKMIELIEANVLIAKRDHSKASQTSPVL